MVRLPACMGTKQAMPTQSCTMLLQPQCPAAAHRQPNVSLLLFIAGPVNVASTCL